MLRLEMAAKILHWGNAWMSIQNPHLTNEKQTCLKAPLLWCSKNLWSLKASWNGLAPSGKAALTTYCCAVLTRTAPCWPPRHSWGRAPQECCSMWHSPTHCSEPSSSQQVPHITVHRSPFFPSQAQSKITFSLYTPMFLPSPFYLFFFFKFVFMKTALSLSEDKQQPLLSSLSSFHG